MVVLNVTYKADKTKLDAFLDAVRSEGLDRASRDEAGNIKYDYYFPECGGDEMLLVEKWRDEEAFRLHTGTPHFKRMGELKGSIGIESVLEIFTV